MSQQADNPVYFLEVAAKAAEEAGAIITEAASRPKNISYKGEVDLVTETDKKSEAAILARLHHYFPGHAIVAEETGASGADASAKYKW
ncbi:MAG TPA: inositol monophosphatase family protein, partial [Candidatus Acidoferrales bacterium]|nr:inositol monophosphatase family protein [Candidatus Acidoferrales bacterium]